MVGAKQRLKTQQQSKGTISSQRTDKRDSQTFQFLLFSAHKETISARAVWHHHLHDDPRTDTEKCQWIKNFGIPKCHCLIHGHQTHQTCLPADGALPAHQRLSSGTFEVFPSLLRTGPCCHHVYPLMIYGIVVIVLIKASLLNAAGVQQVQGAVI